MVDEFVASGHLGWVDLSTADVEAAVSFYRALFDWTVTTNETPMGGYAVGSVGDRQVAGMMGQPAATTGAPSVWTTYFFVDELDATVSTIVAAGGSVLTQPFEIPDGARVGVVADPGGAMFALISEQPQPGPYLSTVVGGVSWVELMSRTPDDATTFYREVFGWEATTQDAAGTPYTVFGLGGDPVAGMVPAGADVPDDAPDSWSVYFTTGDCAATVEQAVTLGGRTILPPTATPMGPFAVLADPQGAVFQVMEYRAVT